MKRLKELALVLAGLAAGLLLAELGVRLIHPMDLQPPFVERFGFLNAKPPYTVIPQRARDFDVTYRTNRYGLRGKDILFQKPPRTYRILALGDSFTWGTGIEENGTYSVLLEDKLNQWAQTQGARSLRGNRFEVVNLGLQGVGIGHNEFLYRKLGRLFHPDLVLLCFIGRDADFERKVTFTDPGTIRRTRRMRSVIRLIPGYDFLCMHSQFLAFLRMYATGLVLRKGTEQLTSSLGIKTAQQRLEYQERETLLTLNALTDEACADGAKMVVTSIDDHLRRYPKVYADMKERARRSSCLSVVEFQVGPSHAFAHDWHWNPEGQCFVAENLFRELTSRNLLGR